MPISEVSLFESLTRGVGGGRRFRHGGAGRRQLDSSGAVTADGMRGSSSCHGVEASCMPTSDFDDVPRPQGAARDIGPYER